MCDRQLQEELAALSNMAGRVNEKMQLDSNGHADSVDLDNLFSFLTDIPTEKTFLDDISHEMSLLADDVQVEVCHI